MASGLIETFRHHSQVLAAKSSALETIHHAGDRGSEREDILEEFISPQLPLQLAVGRGEIRATNADWSKQSDLVIYDRLKCPRLFVGARTQIFPVESVAAVIEVKSNLNSKTIQEATENIRRARSLEKVGVASNLSSNALTFGEPTPLFGAVFAFDSGLSFDTFQSRWEESQSVLPESQRINLLCVLGKFVVLHVDRIFHLWDQSDTEYLRNFHYSDSKQDSLLMFTLLLMRVLGEYRFGSPDLFQYYFSGGQRLEF